MPDFRFTLAAWCAVVWAGPLATAGQKWVFYASDNKQTGCVTVPVFFLLFYLALRLDRIELLKDISAYISLSQRTTSVRETENIVTTPISF
jgi:hypothetical protein